ncbi:PLP-dependent aminotransferase family protein [Paenibacillus sp. CC-CFT747]|nr:PLP-dependent aminotransferase family protein [Paenibacillus sp. CC-CFT747]
MACSRNTVLKAYEELEKKHLVYSVAKSGYYVVEAPMERRTGTGTNDVIDFLSAGPDKAVIPYREFQHCLNQAIETYREDMFTYSDTLGLPSLRTELARHLRDLQVFAPPSRLAVVSGSQQALHLLVSLPFPNGRRGICVEQPTHPAMVESLRQQGVPVHGIEITGAGLDLDRLESLFRDEDIKLFYTVSRFHNPTGYSYTNTEKRRIVELAEKHDVYLIEDDYMGDLDADAKQDPMFAYEPSGRVIYTKSFSKVMLPGIRLGLAVLPDFLLVPFEAAKFASDLHSPVLTQGALEIYLRNGLFAAHIQRMRSLYRRKALLLQEACRKHLPASASFTGALSGFYSTIGLPSPSKPRS